MHGMHGGMLHLRSGLIKVLLHFIFNHQCFCGFCSGNALVEVPGDLRVDFPDPAV